MSYGILFNGTKSFLRSPLNIIDTISTIALIIQFALNNPSHTFAGKALMILISLRILRITIIKEGFKLSIQAIVKSFPQIIETLGVGALFLFILAVIGISFFKGRMHYCDKTNIISGNVGKEFNVYYCMDSGGEWRNNNLSFDNIFSSFFILFELITSNCWWLFLTELVEDYRDGIGETKERNYSVCFFAIVCSIIGFLYIRAIFNGIINHAFNKEKEEIEGIKNLKYAQRKWVQFSKIIFKASPIKVV
jgi:hypothetical protein